MKVKVYLIPESLEEDIHLREVLKLQRFELDIKRPYSEKVFVSGRYECTEDQLPSIKESLRKITNG